ncbi:MAG: GNAT family N-acetyltransferase [Ferruginibacter sp.]
MNITAATDQDLPNMIELLRISLGEGLIPKSERMFRWKHVENPFGGSKIMLAKDQDQIIGLRAFMRWDWVNQHTHIRAVRAVDTATHPAHQGKGIFKKLTLQAVGECTAEGVSLVFNSPNQKSRPGYLKMGWKQIGKLPLHMGIGSILPMKYHEQRLFDQLLKLGASQNFDELDSGWQVPLHDTFFQTRLDKQYLVWRYQHCPVFTYHTLIQPDLYGIVFRFRNWKGFSELRICETWTCSPAGEKAAREVFKQLIRTTKPLFVSCAPTPDWTGKMSKPFGLPGSFFIGPITTIRPLAMKNLHTFESFNNWKPSIGAMELF